jgi:serine hydrolase
MIQIIFLKKLNLGNLGFISSKMENKISNVVIVHGCPGNAEKSQDEKTRTYDKHWIPWVNKKVEEKNISVEVPLMPEPWNPDYLSWKKEFEKILIDNETILVGHSGGCAFLVRWLGETKKEIKKLILVAPWKIPSEEFSEGENELYNYEIEKKIKENIEKTIIFISDDEEEDGKKSAKIFQDTLGGELIELKEHGHFTEGEMGTEEFPELLEKILK